MSKERRRYFRIDEKIGISWHILDGRNGAQHAQAQDTLSRVSANDEKIERLLLQLGKRQPLVAELMALLNQKVQQLAEQFVFDNQLMTRIAYKVKEASISACGIAFIHDESVAVGASLRLELTLLPSQQQVVADGRIVACEQTETPGEYYWRLDYYGMSKADQEKLIQHVVRSQSQQLKSKMF